MTERNTDFLRVLEDVIDSRMGADPSASYTASLLRQGTLRIAQKVGEEGVELALAATQPDRERIVGEAADLVFHLLVLLRSRGITLADVTEELEARHHR